MKKVYTILNCEGNILRLEIERYQDGFTTLTFRAKMNSGVGHVYFSISEIQLLEFFNSKITLSEIVQNAKENQFSLIRCDKSYIVKKSYLVNSLQCGDMLYRDILNDMKISYFDIVRLLNDNNLSNEKG